MIFITEQAGGISTKELLASWKHQKLKILAMFFWSN